MTERRNCRNSNMAAIVSMVRVSMLPSIEYLLHARDPAKNFAFFYVV